MSFYSQFLTAVDAVTVPNGSVAVVGSAVDFGAVHSSFLAWASVDPSSPANATVYVDTSIDGETWFLSETSVTVDAGTAKAIEASPGRYVRVRAAAITSPDTILTVQVALEG